LGRRENVSPEHRWAHARSRSWVGFWPPATLFLKGALRKTAKNGAIEILARVCPDRLRTSSQEGTVGFAWAFSQGPASGSPLFAWSLTNGYEQPLDYHLVFYLYAFMSVIILLWSLLLPTSVNLSPVSLARGRAVFYRERRSFAKTGSGQM
jgi:hypothetical protein